MLKARRLIIKDKANESRRIEREECSTTSENSVVLQRLEILQSDQDCLHTKVDDLWRMLADLERDI